MRCFKCAIDDGSDSKNEVRTSNKNSRARKRSLKRTKKTTRTKPILLTCDQCKVYQFCSEDCRHQSSKIHDKDCQRLQELRQAVGSLEHNADLYGLYAGQVGHFRKHRVSYTYLRARDKLVDSIRDIACNYHIPRHWEEIHSILQENLRLCHVNPQRGWCQKFSVSLLHGGRIDDTISFSLYTMQRLRSKAKDNLHEGSKEGEWIYDRYQWNQNQSGTRDTIDWHAITPSADIFFVYIIYLAKLKKIMTYTFIKQAMSAFLSTSFGEVMEAMLGPLALLLEFIVPLDRTKKLKYDCHNGNIDTDTDTDACATLNNVHMFSWTIFLEDCEDLHSELMSMTEAIHLRDPNLFKFMKQMCHAAGDGNTIARTMKKPPVMQMEAYQTVKMCLYSLDTIPDVHLWLKYCERHLKSNNRRW